MKMEKQKHIVTVLLHDYYHRCVFNKVIGERDWNRLDSRLEQNVDKLLALLEQQNIKATFFTLGWLAEKRPSIIRKIAGQGHEIASAGYRPVSIDEMSPAEFRQDLRLSKQLLEEAGANQVIGYRSAYKWLRRKHEWAREILIEEGYVYDASYKPDTWKVRSLADRYLHRYQSQKGSLWEVPVSTARVFGFNVPISGGNYLRQFPGWFLLKEFDKWIKENKGPFVLYFHPWELDTELPRINSVGLFSSIRQYRNLGRLADLLPYYFERGNFQSIQQFLNIPLQYREKKITETRSIVSTFDLQDSADTRQEISVVIPCYNEESSLSYLAKALTELEAKAKAKYKFNYIFVDDDSKDQTLSRLQSLFGDKKNCRILHHEQNKGVAASIQTGIRAADTDIICSIDADCTYDPVTLLDTIPLLQEGVDVVVASPYHKNGHVANVPKWRLLLSKHLSKFYHLVLKNKLATYTSCFRVYRREAVAHIDLQHHDYIGIVELLAKVDMSGGTIVEFPTTLYSRLLGYSKMKVLKTIAGHVKFLLEIISMKSKGAFDRRTLRMADNKVVKEILTWKL